MQKEWSSLWMGTQWVLMYLADTLCMCFCRGWDCGSVANLEAVQYMIFSTSRWKGSRSVHASSVSVGADLIMLVMHRVACLCILANLVMNSFVPFLFLLSGMRNRSAA